MASISFRFTAWVCATGRLDGRANKRRLRTTSEGERPPVSIHIIDFVIILLLDSQQTSLEMPRETEREIQAVYS